MCTRSGVRSSGKARIFVSFRTIAPVANHDSLLQVWETLHVKQTGRNWIQTDLMLAVTYVKAIQVERLLKASNETVRLFNIHLGIIESIIVTASPEIRLCDSIIPGVVCHKPSCFRFSLFASQRDNDISLHQENEILLYRKLKNAFLGRNNVATSRVTSWRGGGLASQRTTSLSGGTLVF